ncbi:MAG TPA: carbohydrate-binding protein [Clostridiales bacterium]|nr:carbohydrate-binding protein [Clostridiales bacterium]
MEVIMMNPDYPFRDADLPLSERVDDLVGRLTLEEKAGLVSSRQNAIERLGISQWGVGCEIARGYVGRTPEEPSTVLPQPIGMAAMFDPDLMYKLGELAGNETRVYYQEYKKGSLMLFGPTVDMERDPRWGRNEEAYGEDPYLTGKMSIAFTKGLKGQDPFYVKTVPGLKHFYANNNEVDRTSCSSNIEPRTKHEYYYKAFKPAITEGGAMSVMASYNELSGVPALVNPDLKDILKDQWGLDFVLSDGGDFAGNVVDHGYVDNHGESIALSIKAGADIMLDGNELVKWSVLDAIKKGLLTEDELDESVKRTMAIRFRLGEFDPDERNPYTNMDKELVNCDEYKGLNRQAAKEQIILLKNDDLLPLNKSKSQKIAVLGPLADKNYMDWYTGYSDYNIPVVDGIRNLIGEDNVIYDNSYDKVALKSKATGKYIRVDEDETLIADSEKATLAETFEFHDWDFGSQNLLSLKNNKFIREEEGLKANGENTYGWFVKEWLKYKNYDGSNLMIDTWNDRHMVTDSEGRLTSSLHPRVQDNRLFTQEVISSGIERAVKIAEASDVAIVCVGNDPMQVARECYDRPDLVLPKHQADLIKAVHAANPKTVVVFVSSYPYAVNWEKDHVPAMLFSSHAGPELGTAVAEVLFGQYNPGGRTPMTWYKSVHELPDILDYDIIGNDMTYLYYEDEPLYPFGYGLSYSTFRYDRLEITKIDKMLKNDKAIIRARVSVTNTSRIDGEEVVQLYFRAENPRVKRPKRQLCGFKRIFIRAGETVEVEFEVRESDIEFYDVTREKLCVEAGDYTFMAGGNCLDTPLKETVLIEGETIPPQTLRQWTPAINYDDKSFVAMDFSKEKNTHFLKTLKLGKRFIKFGDVDLSEVSFIEMNAGAHVGKGAINVHIDSPDNEPITSVEVPITGGPAQFTLVKGALKTAVEGIHDLYLTFEEELSIMDLRLG